MKQEAVVLVKGKKKFTPEEEEFIEGFRKSFEDIKRGRVRRVA